MSKTFLTTNLIDIRCNNNNSQFQTTKLSRKIPQHQMLKLCSIIQLACGLFYMFIDAQCPFLSRNRAFEWNSFVWKMGKHPTLEIHYQFKCRPAYYQAFSLKLTETYRIQVILRTETAIHHLCLFTLVFSRVRIWITETFFCVLFRSKYRLRESMLKMYHVMSWINGWAHKCFSTCCKPISSSIMVVSFPILTLIRT